METIARRFVAIYFFLHLLLLRFYPYLRADCCLRRVGALLASFARDHQLLRDCPARIVVGIGQTVQIDASHFNSSWNGRLLPAIVGTQTAMLSQSARNEHSH